MSTAEPQQESLSPNQVCVLRAVTQTLLPPMTVPNTADDGLALLSPEESEARERFWGTDIARDPSFLAALTTVVTTKLHPDERLQLLLLLSALSTTIGSAVVFGVPCTSPFPAWSAEVRSARLRSLQHSWIADKRKAFTGLKRLICGTAFSVVQTRPDGTTADNPFWGGMGYPGPCHHTVSEEEDTRHLQQNKCHVARLQGALLHVTEDKTLEFDCIVIGSGAGGGVAAATLATASHSTLILEKGSYFPPAEISNLEIDAMDKMYEKHSLLTTHDGSIMILAGSTVGGGMAINWGCCIETPSYVRNEWVKEHGLLQFRPNGSFDESLKSILQRIGATSSNETVVHNRANTSFLEGCKKMGYSCNATKVNIKDSKAKSAGFTNFGDRYGNKQSGLETYLQDAIQNGAKIIEKCKVLEVQYELDKKTGRKRATGVIACVNDKYKITIRARKAVVVSAGSLHTPCLLHRSGFKNRHIGRHLHLHPVTPATGIFSSAINQCEGAPMTTVCEEFSQGPKTDGYGAKLEVPVSHSGIAAALTPYLDTTGYRNVVRNFNVSATLIVLQRDRSEGRVYLGKDGFNPEIHYTICKDDEESMMLALVGTVKVLLAAGAVEVRIGHDADNGITSSSSDADVESYGRKIVDRGMTKHNFVLASAHQMGSCRMGTKPDNSVVNPNGEVWECDNLFIFDASIFPTASGANPMVTNLTLSHMLSKRLVGRWKDKSEREFKQITQEVDGFLIWLMKNIIVVFVLVFVPFSVGQGLRYAATSKLTSEFQPEL